LRDTALPLRLTRLQPRVQQLNAFAAASVDNQRAAESTLSRLLTEYKTDAGKLIGLRDDRLVTRKTAFEGKIRRAVEGNAKLGVEAGKVWDEITAAYRKWKPLDKPYEILEGEPAPGSRLFRMARQIVRGEPLDDSGDAVPDGIGRSGREGGAAQADPGRRHARADREKNGEGRQAGRCRIGGCG
jgi:hypothetical protein